MVSSSSSISSSSLSNFKEYPFHPFTVTPLSFLTGLIVLPNFTSKYGISGSVMDYHAVSLLDNGVTMFQTQPGPYDLWAIEYGYSEKFNTDENIFLENIASKANNPYLAYGTDEDAFGLSSKGIDPLCSTWDMSSDPIAFYSHQIFKQYRLLKKFM